MNTTDLREQFGAWAPDYDASLRDAEWGFERYDEVLDRVAELAASPAGGKVLDLGVGTGNLALRFINAGATVCGLDISPEMLMCARSKLPSLQTVESDFRNLGAAGDHYDAIVSSYALHHISDQAKIGVLVDAQQRLTREGVIVVADYAFEHEEHRLRVRDQLIHSGRGDWWEEIATEHYADLSFIKQAIGATRDIQLERMTEFVWIMVLRR
jgi:ubiquinone/menaquinone biosynthesis C-methylase UbiE